MKYKIALIAIFLFGLLLRLIYLDKQPSGFLADEAAIGYNAYSLLQNGRDEWGRFLPLDFFKSFGDYKNPLVFYLTVPFIKIFGLNELAVRLPAALSGAVSILVIFLLAAELWGKKHGLAAAIFLAFSPWHIINSRLAHGGQGVEAVLFALIATYLFLRWIKTNRNWQFLISVSFFLFSIQSYHTSRVFVPLFFFFLLWIYGDQVGKRFKKKKWLLVVGLLIFIHFLAFLNPIGQARIVQTTRNFQTGIINDINERRGFCQQFVASPVCRLFYNRFNAVTAFYLTNYLEHFSLKTLYTQGLGLGTFMIYKRSLFYVFELPLFLVGIFILISRRQQQDRLTLGWLFLFPLASAITGSENALRMLIGIPAFILLETAGLMRFWLWLRTKLKLDKVRKAIAAVFALVIMVSLIKFMTEMFLYSKVHSKAYHFGYRDLFNKLKDLEKNYQRIHLTPYLDNEAYIFYLFYRQYPPRDFQNLTQVERMEIFDRTAGWWVRVKRVGKYYFELPKTTAVNREDLLIMSPDEFRNLISSQKREIEPLFEITNPGGEKIFIGVEGKNGDSDIR